MKIQPTKTCGMELKRMGITKKCMARMAYIKNDEISQISNLTQHLKKFSNSTLPLMITEQ